MGGSSRASDSQLANANSQTAIAQQQNYNSEADRAARDKAQAPAIGLYTALTSGDPHAALTAASPLIAPISQGYQAAKDSIFNNIAPGAGRDAALANLNIQKNAATSGIFASQTAGAYDKLANIGSGLGAFSLQDIGASLNAFGGATKSNDSVMQAQAANKASTMGFLGQLAGAGGAVGAAKFCWIAEALYGVDDKRTHLVRAWLNGPFVEKRIGRAVMWLYGAIGRRVAALARRSPLLRRLLRPLFDSALQKAMEYSR